MEIDILIVFCAVFFVIIVVLTSAIIYMKVSKSRRVIIKKALEDARKIKMDSITDARSEVEQIKLDVEQEVFEQLNRIEIAKNELNKKRENLFNDIEKLAIKEEKILFNENKIIILDKEYNKKLKELDKKMSDILDLSIDEIKENLFNNIKKELMTDANRLLEKSKQDTLNKAKEEATTIILSAMESISSEVVISNSTTRVEIPDKEMKGRIIGKEGRNIKAFEQYGGVDIIIDDSPNSIVVSSFNPIRREVAIRALNFLIKDGRIQPVKIEETLIEEEKRINLTFEEIGNEVIKDLGMFDIPEELKPMIGKLKFRTSYGQNVLQHSIEVAKLSAKMASELDLDPYIALKSGLLHDIGKAVDFEQEGSHVALGAKMLKKLHMDELIINVVESHHGDIKKESFYAEIVSIADTLSAARPGARNNNFEDFFNRLDEVEKVICSVSGVKKAFVLQAGRQIRVIVDSETIDDIKFINIEKEINEKVKEVNKIPGEIVITLIREKRLVSKINTIDKND